MTSKKIELRHYIVSILTLLIIFVASMNYAVSYVGDPPSDIYLYPPYQEATYIIGPYNSTHYYAKNHTGYSPGGSGYEFLSDNASLVIQNCIDTMDEGLIQIKAGTYSLDSTITIDDDNTILEGEGRATVIDVGANGITAFNFNSSSATHQWGNGIRSMELSADNKQANSVAIYVNSQNQFYLDDVMIGGFEEAFVVGTDDAFHNTIKNLYCYDCTIGVNLTGKFSNSLFDHLFLHLCDTGLDVSAGFTGLTLIAPQAELCTVDGIVFDVQQQGLTINGGYFANNGRDALTISGEGAYPSRGIKISGGYYSANGNNSIKLDLVDGVTVEGIYSQTAGIADINITSSANNVTIFSNTLLSSTPISNAGSDVKIEKNKGYFGAHDYVIASSFPSSPLEGMKCYLTTNHTLWIYNSTHWVNVGEGTTGPQGPAGPAGNINNTQFDWTTLVYQNSTAAYLYDRTGFLDSDSNHTLVISWALGNLTSGRDNFETTVLIGNFTIDHTIQLDGYTRLDLYNARIWLEAWSNCTMIENAGASDDWIQIYGGILNGQKSDQSAGSGIVIEADSGTCRRIEVHDTLITNMKDYGVHMHNVNKMVMTNVKVWSELIWTDGTYGADDHACYLQVVSDALVDNCDFGSNGCNLYMAFCSAMRLSNLYLGGDTDMTVTEQAQFAIQGCKRNVYENIMIDTMKAHAIRIWGTGSDNSSYNVFNNIKITRPVRSQEDIDAIRLEDISCYNQFNGILILPDKKTAETWYRFNYGIHEVDNADYNSYGGTIQIFDYVTSAYSIGTNSLIDTDALITG